MRIQGHLSDYPLLELLAILARRRESGCLQISFKPVPGTFYFKDGNMVAARMGHLEGFSAINLAFSMENAPFNFENLAFPRESATTDQHQTLLLSRLLGMRVGQPGISDRSENQSPATVPRPSAIAVTTPLPPTIHRATSDAASAPATVSKQAAVTVPAPLVKEHPDFIINQLLGGNLVSLASTTWREAVALPGHERLAASTLILLLTGVIAVTGFAIRLGRGHAANPASAGIPAASAKALDALPGSGETVKTTETSPRSVENSGAPKTGQVNTKHLTAKVKDTDLDQLEAAVSSSAEDDSSQVASASDQNPSKPNQKQRVSDRGLTESDQNASLPDVRNRPELTSKMITVVVHIVDGRVIEAYVRDHSQGLEAYEATAIRLARQHRYSSETTGKKAVAVRVTREQQE